MIVQSCSIPNCAKPATKISGNIYKGRLSVVLLCHPHYDTRKDNISEQTWRHAVLTKHRTAEKNADGTTDEAKLVCRVCKEIGERLSVDEVCTVCTERIVNRETYKLAIKPKDVEWYLSAVFGDLATNILYSIGNGRIQAAINDRRHDDDAENIAKRLCVEYMKDNAGIFWTDTVTHMEGKLHGYGTPGGDNRVD